MTIMTKKTYAEAVVVKEILEEEAQFLLKLRQEEGISEEKISMIDHRFNQIIKAKYKLGRIIGA